MKSIIGWLIAWSFYWLGDLESKTLRAPDSFPQWYFDFFYSIYNWIMNVSAVAQDWGKVKCGPWEKVSDDAL